MDKKSTVGEYIGKVPNSIGTRLPVQIAPKWDTKTNRYNFNIEYSSTALSHYSLLRIQRSATGDEK